MLRNLFRRAAFADLDMVMYVYGATGLEAYTDGNGLNRENYHLEKDGRTRQWNLVHSFGAINADMAGTTIATIPKLADAALVLRGVLEQDLKPHYAGIVNGWDGREYSESQGDYYLGGTYASLSIVERALKQQPR